MPHLRIRSLSEQVVANLSTELPNELATILNTSVDNFSVERIQTNFFREGKRVEGDPMIEVLWFDRGQEIKNRCAEKITELVRKQINADYISVVFVALPKENYFENGQHF